MADTNIKQIVFNKLSKAKYEELKAAGSLNANEFYITPDESVTQTSFDTAVADLEGKIALKANTADVYAKTETYSQTEIDNKIAEKDSLPAQADNSGKFLSTNGTAASWEALPTATTAKAGIVKLASSDEVAAGTDTTVAVSAKDLADGLAPKATTQALTDGLALKADKTELEAEVTAIEAELAKKAVAETVNAELALKATKAELESEVSAIEAELAKKAVAETVNAELALKANTADVYTKTDVDGKVSAIEADIALKADKATTYTKTEVDALVNSTFHYKGTVANEAALPTTGNTIGDVWNIEDTGANFAWDGNNWDKLSETVDLSGYYTSAQVDAELAKKANSADVYTKTDIDGKVSAIETEVATKATKAELESEVTAIEAELAKKAVKTEVEASLALKADKTALETEVSELEAAIALKADSATTYSKTDVDGKVSAINEAIATKANATDVYTKTDIDGKVSAINDAVALKADTATVNAELATKATKTELSEGLALKADAATTYSKTDVDGKVSAINAELATKAVKTEVDTALATKATTQALTDGLALKADKADTYTKTEVDTAIADRVVAVIRTWE